MIEQIYPLFEYLTDVSVNFWPYLLLAIPPILVFSVRPDGNAWIRIGRLVAAVACFYVLISLTLHTYRTLQSKAYEQCRSESQHRTDSPAMHQECKHHINISDNTSNTITLGHHLGWMPGLVYVGLWELAWRVRHRKEFRALRRRDVGRETSTFLIVAAFTTLFTILILILGYPIYYFGLWQTIILVFPKVIEAIDALFL